MNTPDTATIRRFIVRQSDCWNSGRHADFLALYREFAANSLTIEYVGKSTLTGDAAWAGLQSMWDGYARMVKIQPVEIIVNGTSAACYYRNLWTDKAEHSTGIEVYEFGEGTVKLRVFH
ncbi:MAG: nuclear transport factor 2 family protein [Aquincola sp.]|nr:nuclear transport factor 2 family protein [Aquincola sp.]|tara:strand:+ start:3455 stop:3811 length:357 start_codon:yes stop_codon:yes gene_type:complete